MKIHLTFLILESHGEILSNVGRPNGIGGRIILHGNCDNSVNGVASGQVFM